LSGFRVCYHVGEEESRRRRRRRKSIFKAV